MIEAGTHGGENWRWNATRHRTPLSTRFDVIENPSAKPRRYPYGFAPPTPEADPEPPAAPRPFAPQIAARMRA